MAPDSDSKIAARAVELRLVAQAGGGRASVLDRPSVAPADRRRSSVALNVGAKRLWLSEDVQFTGNATEIKPESLELIDQLAAVLTSHENVDGLVLQGHTNSKCGLDCNGAMVCATDTCQRTFGASGGAVAFSLSRAMAVKAALVARGHARARVDGHGREAHAGVRGGRPILQHAHDAVGRRPRRAPGRPQAAGAGLLAARDRSGRGHSWPGCSRFFGTLGRAARLSWCRCSNQTPWSEVGPVRVRAG